MKCRNCGSANLREFGFIGDVAPFFLKRVLNMEGRGQASVEMQICDECSFLQTKYPFADSALAKLYVDYRSDSYNAERIKYEPSYAAFAGKIGECEEEVKARVSSLTEWLAEFDIHGDILDFGGADGRFLPDLGTKFVYERSSIAPVAGVTKITDESELGLYSYVQLAHVLEHVSQPLTLLSHVASLVSPGGYLYIEVPQEISEAELDAFRSGQIPRRLGVHEHINLYCRRSVECLFRAAGLNTVKVESITHDLGWGTSTIIRALAQVN